MISLQLVSTEKKSFIRYVQAAGVEDTCNFWVSGKFYGDGSLPDCTESKEIEGKRTLIEQKSGNVH